MERIVIEIVGDASKIQSTIDQLQKLGQVDNNNAKTFQANNAKTNKGLQNTTNNVNALDKAVSNLGATIAGAFAVGSLIAFGKEAVQTSAKIESIGKSLEFITGSAKGAQTTMEYLRKLSEKLGLEFTSTAQAFKLFAGATSQSGMSLNQTKSIFESVSKAVATMGLSAEDAQGVFLALSQVMSKGTVQAEELRGQIGERIPGAFTIAAKAIGVTEQQLNKMLEQGQVISKDFLPKFAAQLEKDLGGGAESAANSTQAALNRLENAWTGFKNWFGADVVSPIVVGASDIVKAMNKVGIANKIAAEATTEISDEFKAVLEDLDKIEVAEMKYLRALEIQSKAQEGLALNEKKRKETIAQLGAEVANFFSDSQKQILYKYLKEEGEQKYLERLSFAGNKTIKTLAMQAMAYEEGTKVYKDEVDKITGIIEDLGKAETKGLETTKTTTKDKIKEIEKLPTAYEKLVASASEFESKLRDLYASGAISNTPLEIKLRTILNEIDLINTKVEQAKNGMDEMTLTKGTEKGGTAKPYTEAITAFGTVTENELATEDIIKNAEKANEEFKRLEEERTRNFQEEQNKRRYLEQQAVNASIQIISMGIDFAYKSKQAEFNNEMNLLDAAYNNKKVSEEDYQKRKKQILNEQAEAEKEAALFRATIDTASAVISAFADGGPILAALAAITGAAQIALIAATPVPQYAEGTEFVQLGKNKKGKDTIPALLNEGEAVIKTDENAKYPGLAKAWNQGKLDDYVLSNFMLPSINPKSYELEAQKSFAENVANSILLNQDFGVLETKLKKLDETEKMVGERIVGAIKDTRKNIW